MRKLKRFALKRKVLFIRAAAALVPVIMALLVMFQTAFAENTYVITDGSRVFTYTTTATDPAVVLGEAGLELGEDDTYTTHTMDGQSQITVQRGRTVTVEYYGELITAASSDETVGQLLTRLNIALGEYDVVSLPLDVQTEDGMQIRIKQVVQTQEVYTADVPHDTTYCYDPSMPEGTQNVLVEGVDGQIRCTASVTYVNGQETERTILAQDQISAAVTEVIAVGSGKEHTAADPDGMPIITDSTITLPTGEVLTYTDTMQARATAYTHTDAGCDFYTSTLTKVRWGTVAVDPRVIPYGTRMFIITNDGTYVYGVSVAEDCGGAIKGNRIDLYMPTHQECVIFGVKDATIYFLGT